MGSKKEKTIGLVMSGGGARGAYQAGVLSAIAEITQDLKMTNPFKIYTGVSAGAINAAFLASGADDFAQTTKGLVDLWSQITSDQVFYTDPISLGKNGIKWLEDISFGGFFSASSKAGKSLLDTAPLRALINKNMQFDNIQANIDSGKLRGVAVTAMDYQTSAGVTFIQSHKDIKMWDRKRRRSEQTKIQAEHVMASSAIPMLFPSISVDSSYYGDGCIRNQSPSGPAIYMGAEKLVVIGVRMEAHLQPELMTTLQMRPPSVAKVINVLLNAVMLDGIEVDLERLEHINKFIDKFSALDSSKFTMRKVDYLWISPTEDIGAIAYEKSSKLPRVVRYLLKGLGSLEDAREVVSYLLFEPSFCTQLIEVGFEDGMRQREKIIKLLTED